MASRQLTELVNSLLMNFGRYPESKREVRRTSFQIADVEYNIQRLSTDVYTWLRVSDLYPCIVDKDGAIPIAIGFGTIFPIPSMPLRVSDDRYPWFIADWVNELLYFYQAKQLEIRSTTVNDVQEQLRNRLTSFLATRSGEDESPPPVVARAVGAAPRGFIQRSNPYLDFEVHTQESGLRVHYTPSYFLDWSNVFGTPTTPSRGWILPGRYKFGVMRSDGVFLLDNANFNIPPMREAHLVLR